MNLDVTDVKKYLKLIDIIVQKQKEESVLNVECPLIQIKVRNI